MIRMHLPITHVRLILLVEGVKHTARLILLAEFGNVLQVAANEAQTAAKSVLGGAFAQLWQDLQTKQDRTDDIDSDVAFVFFGHGPVERQDAGVLDDGVQAFQGLDAGAKLLDGVVAGEVELPHLETVWGAASGVEEALHCRVALGGAADSKNDQGRV